MKKYIHSFRFLWPCIVNKSWSERENQQDATVRCLLSTLSQHVSGIIMPIFRRPRRVLLHVVCCNTRLGLLKMGIMMPETCWESIDNKHLTVASCWFSLSLHDIHCYLKCIVYDKLLKPRQSFRITLYLWQYPNMKAALSTYKSSYYTNVLTGATSYIPWRWYRVINLLRSQLATFYLPKYQTCSVISTIVANSDVHFHVHSGHGQTGKLRAGKEVIVDNTIMSDRNLGPK